MREGCRRPSATPGLSKALLLAPAAGAALTTGAFSDLGDANRFSHCRGTLQSLGPPSPFHRCPEHSFPRPKALCFMAQKSAFDRLDYIWFNNSSRAVIRVAL